MAENNNDRKVLLSLRNVDVKFNVRGRILSAIRNVSLDIYENESIAIVGESGSGKSVLTKTFAGMLDSNGYISNGSIIFSDDEVSKTTVKMTSFNKRLFKDIKSFLDKNSALEAGASDYVEYLKKEQEIKEAKSISAEDDENFDIRIKSLTDKIVDTQNYLLTLDKHSADEAEEIGKCEAKIAEYSAEKEAVIKERKSLIELHKAEYSKNTARMAEDSKAIAALKESRTKKIEAAKNSELPEEISKRNEKITYEVLLSIGRYPRSSQLRFLGKLKSGFKKSMSVGEDLEDPEVLNRIFETCAFRVEFREYDKEAEEIRGYAIIDCAKVKFTNDWQQIRGRRIATVFQDPMTSLNPVITIGKQIMTVILKHQQCSAAEAKRRTIDIMGKVGIPDPEKRFNDYPFQYSGGMRQRIVIAIALSCQPKILICDEPTTALDVTIQAQIIRLIKDLQHELGFTTVYITHDLGVVANVAERVAVLYAGQIVEIGTVEDIFFDPRHPYTWALLSSLPQLTERGQELFSVPGTPPSLYNKIVGDAFAPRNKYAMAIDLEKEPPVFKVSDTHYAKTWLLDPRAPKIEAPEIIRDLHAKMVKTYVDIDSEGGSEKD